MTPLREKLSALVAPRRKAGSTTIPEQRSIETRQQVDELLRAIHAADGLERRIDPFDVWLADYALGMRMPVYLLYTKEPWWVFCNMPRHLEKPVTEILGDKAFEYQQQMRKRYRHFF